MILRCLEVGPLAANCYVMGDESTGAAVVVDAGGDGERILALLGEEGLKARYIVCTHAHYDHVGAVQQVAAATGAEVCVHRLDAAMLAQPESNLSLVMGGGAGTVQADRLLECDETLESGGVRAEVWCTPGHTPGSISLKVGDDLFTGDLLFQHSVGRQDLPGGSWDEMKASLMKVMALPDGTRVHPGHGPGTTMGEERRHNPYLVSLGET